MILQNEPKIQYKFIKENSGTTGLSLIPPKKIEITLKDEVSLEDLLETFQDFLIISGFQLAENESVAIIRETSQERDEDNESDTEI